MNKNLSVIFLILASMNCYTFRYQSPYADREIVLAPQSASCRSKRVFDQWFGFYGTVALNKINMDNFLREPQTSYRITETYLPGDVVVSLLLGFISSVTKKTLILESCDQKKMERPAQPISVGDELEEETRPKALKR